MTVDKNGEVMEEVGRHESLQMSAVCNFWSVLSAMSAGGFEGGGIG